EIGGGMVVTICRDDDVLTINNPKHARRGDTRGTGSGLKHIQARYRLLSERMIRIENNANEFRVIVPLLPCAP
ncbi:MAG: hypothetical protein ABI644_05020, partial [Arenimonas sp.]